MRTRSEKWTKMAVRGRFSLDVKAEIGGVSYTAISAPNIERSAMANPMTVGNCIASTVKFSVRTNDSIAKGAKIIIKARITNDGATFSEWKDFGTFFISKRENNNGMIVLEGYDAMIKGSQNYVDPTKSDDRIGWPKAQKTCVNEIAKRMGVTLDSRTVLKTGSAYQVDYPTNYTMTQVLGFIGACNGGNWVITPENKLRLIPLVPLSSETFDIVDYDYSNIFSTDGYKLIYKEYTENAITNTAGGGLINVPVALDKITTGKAQAISRVTITVDDSLGYTNGDDTGTELKITGIPYASQTICDDLYDALKNVVYAPFSASKTCFDPCTELGDWVIIGDEVRSVIYKQSITLGVDFRANIEAPGKDETEDEFPYLGEVDRLKSRTDELKKYVENSRDEINSKIEQTRESILLEVSGKYATGESVSASLKVLGKEISSKVSSNDLKDEVSSQISQTASTIRLEASKIVWTADKSSMTEEGVLTASGANITGEITAESGTIGGFSINKQFLQYGDMSNDDNRFLLYPSGSASTYCTGNKTTSGWTIVVGSNFGVLKDGSLFSTNATITGKVTANEGKIGGLYIGSKGELSRSMPEAKDETTGKWIPNAYTFLAYPYNENNDIWTVAGKDVKRPAMLLGRNFCVTTEGKLYATGAEIAGNITASKLTLAKNAKFVDENGKDVIPEIPDTSIFIEKDGAITEVTDPNIIAQIEAGTYEGTSKYFAVDNNGLLVAANAVIMGKIIAHEGEFTGKVVAESGVIGGWEVGTGSEVDSTADMLYYTHKENDVVKLEVGFNPRSDNEVFYIKNFNDESAHDVIKILKSGAIFTVEEISCKSLFTMGGKIEIVGAEISNDLILNPRSTDIFTVKNNNLRTISFISALGHIGAVQFFSIDETGNKIGEDLQTQINLLSFSVGDVLTVSQNTSFSGYVPYGRKGIHFLIPLSKPVPDAVTRVTLSGKVLARGVNGALNSGSDFSLQDMGENNTISTEIINGIGIKVMLKFDSEIPGAVNNDVISVGTREALTITFA